jgi:hypothetical protein
LGWGCCARRVWKRGEERRGGEVPQAMAADDDAEPDQQQIFFLGELFVRARHKKKESQRRPEYTCITK